MEITFGEMIHPKAKWKVSKICIMGNELWVYTVTKRFSSVRFVIEKQVDLKGGYNLLFCSVIANSTTTQIHFNSSSFSLHFLHVDLVATVFSSFFTAFSPLFVILFYCPFSTVFSFFFTAFSLSCFQRKIKHFNMFVFARWNWQ